MLKILLPMVSHIGALGECLSSQINAFVEAADQRYVRREELAELLGPS